MKRIAFFFTVLALMFAVSFFLSVWLFPNWLNQNGWVWKLSAALLVTGIGVLGSAILSEVLSFLFEDRDFRERLLFRIGDKYHGISLILDQFTRQEISKEKKSKKYIPNVFVETTEIKEKLRYFSEPFVFFPKIIEQANKSLQAAYIVNVLKQVHYPVDEPAYPQPSVKSNNQKSLFDSLQTYSTYLDKKLLLTDILIKRNGAGIKPEHLTKIPQEYSHIHGYMYPYLQFYWSYGNPPLK